VRTTVLDRNERHSLNKLVYSSSRF
jgi:hypothetical protein